MYLYRENQIMLKKTRNINAIIVFILLIGTTLALGGVGVLAHPVAPNAQAIQFDGLDWYLKAGDGLGPGNNDWSDSNDSIWVDEQQRLHLKIRQIDGDWHSAEIRSILHGGYGTYRFSIDSPLNKLDRNVVFGMFLYRDDERELDIEISSWREERTPPKPNAQYVVQPYYLQGHLQSFNLLYPRPTIHEIDWQSDRVTFRTLRDVHSRNGQEISEWTYEGEDIPDESDNMHLHLNLWLLEDVPANNEDVEVIISQIEAPLIAMTKPTITISAVNGNMVEGTVSPASFCSSDYRVILYARTDIYYIQPTTSQPTISINSDCTWQSTTHTWDVLAAHLVNSDYSPAPQIHTQLCPPLTAADILAASCFP
jgi:hypothetical protein